MYRYNNPTGPGMHNTGSNDYTSFQDSVTKVTYRRNAGYFEKVGASCCGIGFGFVFFLAAFPVLFLNEGRAVQTARSLDEGLRAVVSLPSSHTRLDVNENKLVHLTGGLRTDKALTDREFEITISAVKLKREVEMFQWVEHEHKREYKEGDRTRVETTYSYTKEWKSGVVNSNAFSSPTIHRNPTGFPIESYTSTATPVFVGEFQLSSVLSSKVSNYQQLPITQRPSNGQYTVLENYYYKSMDPYRPEVGDLRIRFSYAGKSHPDNENERDQVSIISRQKGMLLTSYQTEAGDQLELLYHGIKTAKEIFDAEHSSNTVLTWVLRFVGWLIMFIGLQIMMDIVRQIVSFLPIIRDIVGLATSIIAFSIATSLSLVTIAIGWLRYRPVLAGSLILAAAVPFYLSRKKAAKENEKSKN